MARSAADLARLLDVLTGPAPHAPLSLPRPERPFSQITPLAPGKRIGWLGDWGGHLPVEDGLTEIGREALARLGAAGVEIVNLPLPDMAPERLWQAFVTLRHHVIATRFAPLLDHPRGGEMKPEMRWEIEGGLRLDIARLREAVAVRAAWYGELAALFGTVDFIALPSAQVWPFAVDESWPRAIAGRAMDSYHRWMEIVTAGSLSGLPVLAMPAGFADGRPAGIQVIGRPQGEAELISLVALYEACV